MNARIILNVSADNYLICELESYGKWHAVNIIDEFFCFLACVLTNLFSNIDFIAHAEFLLFGGKSSFDG